MNRTSLLLLLFLLGGNLLLAACSRQEPEAPPAAAASPRKLQVVTTLFPLYDFARAVGGDHADVTLLLPPGVEPHSFDPRPEDLIRISRADLFVYTHPAMEPWAVRLNQRLDAARVSIVDASTGTRLLQVTSNGHEHEHGHEHGDAIDPHLWLDFDNAAIMVGNLAGAMAAADPQQRAFYLTNAAAYQAQLRELDTSYRATLANCSSKILLQGGHFAFGYLAKRYGLDYRAAAAVSPDAEPTPAKMAELVRQMRIHRLKHLFSEELVSPRLAVAIARETGATILPLHAGHNVSREELADGTTFPAIMKRNLDHLATGLQCR